MSWSGVRLQSPRTEIFQDGPRFGIATRHCSGERAAMPGAPNPGNNSTGGRLQLVYKLIMGA